MSSINTQTYSAKQLLPFTGNIQIIKTPSARALTLDGLNWQIQTICESHQQQWNINNQMDNHRRYIIYGTWDRNNQLSRFPIDPTLDVPAETLINDTLTRAIHENIPNLPFKAADKYEYWLLDKNDFLPVALLATSVDMPQVSSIPQIKRWRCRSGNEMRLTGVHKHYSNNPFLTLEAYINNQTSMPLCTQWFLRSSDGSGTGLHGQNIDDKLLDRSLQACLFPELLLKNQWANQQMNELINDYIQHLAPRLLTIHNLSTDSRIMLETLAQTQPTQVLRYYMLYPEIADQNLINKILVEAKLRETTK